MESKLDEILMNYYLNVDAETYIYIQKHSVPEAKSALKKLVMECVPEERNVAPRWDQSKASWDQLLCDVWNDSRTQTLKAIEERFN